MLVHRCTAAIQTIFKHTEDNTMIHKFAEIAFASAVRESQQKQGSGKTYAHLLEGGNFNGRLGEKEAALSAHLSMMSIP